MGTASKIDAARSHASKGASSTKAQAKSEGRHHGADSSGKFVEEGRGGNFESADRDAPSSANWSFDASHQEYIVECPHCSQPHLVPASQLFCCQFTCGADAHTGLPLKAHISDRELEKLHSEGLIIAGCGGRFKFH